MSLSFRKYAQQRNEAFGWLNKITGAAKAATGVEDERGKRDLSMHTALDAGKQIAQAGAGAKSAFSKGAEVAGNIATGNVVGAAFSIWGFLKEMSGMKNSFQSFTKAGRFVDSVLKKKAELSQHLNQTLEPAAAKRAADAIFEIDVQGAESVPPPLWPTICEDFMARLASGFDNLEKKSFATVCFENLQKWLSRYGSQAQEVEQELSSLLMQRKQAAQVLAEPKVAKAIQLFAPPEAARSREPDVQSPDLIGSRWDNDDSPSSHKWGGSTSGQQKAGQEPHIRWDNDESPGYDKKPEKKKHPTQPKEGDSAYTKYHGETYIGKLEGDVQNGRFQGKIIDDRGRSPFRDGSAVRIGYDEPCVWDEARDMWHCPADYD